MTKSLFPLFLTLLLLPSFASADLVLGLKWSDGNTDLVRQVNSGQSLSVDMFLLDTDGSVPELAEGLGSGGGALFQTDGSATITPGAVTPNPGFDFTAGGPLPLNGRSGYLADMNYAALAPVGFGLANIPLGTFALTLSGAAGETGEISSDVWDSTGVEIVNETFDTPKNLDAILSNYASRPENFGTLSFAITGAAVPEASTCLVGGLLFGGWYVSRRRRRKATPPV